ncbi:MAG: hypothetical protein II811_04810 [Spirochaetaceae bacterium]|nr:hypothetical protein [Spirochaetaceae bacterium]
MRWLIEPPDIVNETASQFSIFVSPLISPETKIVQFSSSLSIFERIVNW